MKDASVADSNRNSDKNANSNGNGVSDDNTNIASDHNTDGGSIANADNVPNVYVSSAYAEKYDLVIGDTISLKEPYGDDVAICLTRRLQISMKNTSVLSLMWMR